ncbi:MAG TPA: hypothetical protein VK327_12335 [Candidatus Paceibacterota bacterium]|nr:hypothetical protein [Candidatus Paceibacterota bacterium]
MLRKLQLALLTLFIGAITSLHAANYNGDLLVGFTTQSGNDLIYDLGPASALTDGKTWNLGSLLSGMNLATTYWGVIGDKNGTPRVAWTTTDGAMVPPSLSGNSDWSTLDTPTKSIYQNFATAGAGQSLTIASTDDNSWNMQAINGALSTQYHNAYEDPTVLGAGSAALFQVLANGSTPTQIGSFTLGANGVLTYNVFSPTVPLPPAPTIFISRSGNTSSISFATTNGATYRLYYTNHTGLTAPLTNWPSLPTTITGNGSTNVMMDTTTDSDRFYRVSAQ